MYFRDSVDGHVLCVCMCVSYHVVILVFYYMHCYVLMGLHVTVWYDVLAWVGCEGVCVCAHLIVLVFVCASAGIPYFVWELFCVCASEGCSRCVWLCV